MVEKWASPAGFSKYEVSNDGFGPDQRPVRSIDRTVGARRVKGVLLKVSVGTNGRPRVKLYDDEGRQRTVEVHALVMLAHVGPLPPGMTVRHYDDDPFNNRWRPGAEQESVAAGGNLFYGSRPEQEADRYRNGRPRPAPRPERHCVLCGAVLTTNGKRCHDCVVELGVNAAAMLRAGQEPAEVAGHLDYPSTEGILALAVTHGGYGSRRTHRVMVTLRRIFGIGHRHGK